MNFKYIYLQKAPLTKKCFQKRVPGLLKEVQIEYAEKNIFIELVQVCKEPFGPWLSGRRWIMDNGAKSVITNCFGR